MSKIEKISCIFVIIVYVIGFIGIAVDVLNNLKEGARSFAKALFGALLTIAGRIAYDGVKRHWRNKRLGKTA